MDDNSRKVGQLLWKLNAGDVSPGVLPKLLQLCAAINAADWHTANHIQVGPRVCLCMLGGAVCCARLDLAGRLQGEGGPGGGPVGKRAAGRNMPGYRKPH
jgi:hypothetical protein